MSGTRPPRLSIIVPCLNEAESIEYALDALAPLRARSAEVIVVDGGSADGTPDIAERGADLVVRSERGRAIQMNRGAACARGEILLFLHADTRLPQQADALVIDGLARTGRAWGRFDVRLAGTHLLFPVIGAAMNVRSRLTGIATGDQAIFVERTLFQRVGGYPPIGLMEDLALSAMLKKHGPPLCLQAKVDTSARRWEKHGVVRTMVLMWRLRLAYRLGANPDELAMRYAPHR
ncbi:MAG TPA: TIGR04283 family arsenosugar biosynthesis glycosyltransferase [Burkholderiales bacterium]|nr:TIGR04283 family arsenosugar biosynthesis glycosyltransferase [Burkholderiales bacterium]